jgi:hypothetical protein
MLASRPSTSWNDVVLLDEAGLDVDLGELGLTVGAQVFVTEAAGDLEITLKASDHEELLVLLGCLRQREELAWAESGRHKEVASPFRRWVREDRRFDFDETGSVEVIASGGGDLVTRADVPVHALAAQIEVAVLHAQVFVRHLAVEVERQDFRLVQHLQLGGDDFDFAGA